MGSHYSCPRCQSENVLEYDDFLECIDCGLMFSKETMVSDADEDNYLSEEELFGTSDAFTKEERDELKRLLDDEEFS